MLKLKPPKRNWKENIGAGVSGWLLLPIVIVASRRISKIIRTRSGSRSKR